nr:HNH endonuclease signature motif containing protein [uncultured Rhodopila sp.]
MKSRLSVLGQLVAASDLRRLKPAPKVADSHYQTPEHRAWRTEVIRRSGGRCQRPGCGRSGVRLFADHVRELRDGGDALDPANGQALCGACHTAKTARARAARATSG